jgi:hypothetical protein
MELPDDVLHIIRDFSRPVTRPDWRELQRMSIYKFYRDIKEVYNKRNTPVIDRLVKRNDQVNYKLYFLHDWLLGCIKIESDT